MIADLSQQSKRSVYLQNAIGGSLSYLKLYAGECLLVAVIAVALGRDVRVRAAEEPTTYAFARQVHRSISRRELRLHRLSTRELLRAKIEFLKCFKLIRAFKIAHEK